MRLIYLPILIAVLGVVLAVPKEHKKKVFKTRSDLPSHTNETSVPALEENSNGTVLLETEKTKEPEKEDKAPEAETIKEVEAPKEPAPEETAPEPASDSHKEKEPTADDYKVEGETTVVPLPKPSYLTKVKNLLRRFMEVLGLPWAREKRKSRKMKHDDIVDGLEFVEDMRAAYGAIRGRQECMRRAACSAGRYLRSVKGKELLIILLEKFAPQVLAEPISYLKESAIYRDPCDYACEADNL